MCIKLTIGCCYWIGGLILGCFYLTLGFKESERQVNLVVALSKEATLFDGWEIIDRYLQPKPRRDFFSVLDLETPEVYSMQSKSSILVRNIHVVCVIRDSSWKLNRIIQLEQSRVGTAHSLGGFLIYVKFGHLKQLSSLSLQNTQYSLKFVLLFMNCGAKLSNTCTRIKKKNPMVRKIPSLKPWALLKMVITNSSTPD